MGKEFFQRKSAISLLLGIILCVMWMGCSTTAKERGGDPAKAEEVGSGPYKSKYYHFDDILVPGDLKYKPKKSFVYETPQFKAGSMIFSKWRVDVDSLIGFFSYHMEKDNWKLVNSFKGKESFLNFSKPDKTCTIKITEKWYGTTHVEIQVGPLGVKKN